MDWKMDLQSSILLVPIENYVFLVLVTFDFESWLHLKNASLLPQLFFALVHLTFAMSFYH